MISQRKKLKSIHHTEAIFLPDKRSHSKSLIAYFMESGNQVTYTSSYNITCNDISRKVFSGFISGEGNEGRYYSSGGPNIWNQFRVWPEIGKYFCPEKRCCCS